MFPGVTVHRGQKDQVRNLTRLNHSLQLTETWSNAVIRVAKLIQNQPSQWPWAMNVLRDQLGLGKQGGDGHLDLNNHIHNLTISQEGKGGFRKWI